MIQFFATPSQFFTLRDFIDSWTPESRENFQEISYGQFPLLKPVSSGVCIFTDLERLLPAELPLAGKLADALRAFPENYTLINEPRHYIGRFGLLRALHERGINDFRAFRLDEISGEVRFPVFLRSDLNHSGPITPLLHSRDELDRALDKKAYRKRALRQQLMVIEYCDCAEAGGIYRKYSVMNVAGDLIPRHVLFSEHWMVKHPDLVSESMAREEMDFVNTFPYAEQIREVFQLAGLGYGRIDYGVRNGRIQVWEINTNPVIVPRREQIDPRRMPAQSQSARQITAALQVLSRRHGNGRAFPFRSASFFGRRVIQFFHGLRRQQRRRA